MKKQFDFLQEAKRDFTSISFLNLFSGLCFSNTSSLLKNYFSFRYLLLCFLFLPKGNSFIIGQTVTISANITAPTSATGDICEGVPQTIQATSTPAGKPLIWRSKDSKGTFLDSLSSMTTYTANPVSGTEMEEIIVTLDEGYATKWDNVVNIDTTGGKFICTQSGTGQSGAFSVFFLASSTDGWVETKIGTTSGIQAAFGLSTTNTSNDPNTINFGIQFSKALETAFVVEDGPITSVSPVTYTNGDIFRVERVGDKIIYKKNRTVFHVSTKTSTSKLHVDVSMAIKDEAFVNLDVSFGDNAYVFPADTIRVPVLEGVSIDIGMDKEEICEGATITVSNPTFEGAPFDKWETANGTINASTRIYTPNALGSIDRIDQIIAFTTAASNGVCPAATDTLLVTVRKGTGLIPVTDKTVCEGDSVLLTSTPSGNADTIKWSSSEGTLSPVNGITDITQKEIYYHPSGTLSTTTRTDYIYLTTDSSFSGCLTTKDTVKITVIQNDSVYNEFETRSICEGDSVQLDAIRANGATAVNWTVHNGLGTILNVSDTNAIYIPSTITTSDLARTDTLFVTTVPTNGCVAFRDTVVVTLYKVAQLNLGQDQTICTTDTATIQALTHRGSIDTVMSWNKLTNGVISALTDQQPNDTLLYKYHTIEAIVFPALSRKDTIIATTATPSSPVPDIATSETCVAAIDTVIITIIDSANISIVAPSDTICEGEMTHIDSVKATINAGATGVTWKLIPAHTGRGVITTVDSVTARYLPNDITDNTTISRNDTLMAISNGLTGCAPDTVYMMAVVFNGVDLSNVADKTICNGGSIAIATTLSGKGSFTATNAGWRIVAPTTGGSFDSNTNLSTKYNPLVFAANKTTPRVDIIEYTATSTSTVCPTFIDSFKVTVNPAHFVEINDTLYGSNSANLDTISVCEGSSTAAISSIRMGGTTTVIWTTTSNSGSFNNATSLTPIYTPNIGQTTDIRYDTLIISSSNIVAACTVARDSIIVQVQRAAALTAAPDTVVCESGTIQLSALSIGIGDTLFWNVLSGGQFENTQIKDTTITAAKTVIYKPTVDVTTQFRMDTIRYYTPKPLGECPIAEDTIFVSVYNAPTVEVADPTKENDTLYVCEGIDLSLDGAYGGGAVGATWSVLSNTGILSGINNDTIATYTPNPGVTNTTRVDTIILTPTIIAGTCSNSIVSDTLYVIVQQGPVVTAAEDSLTMCEGTSIDLVGTFGSVATGFTWSTKVAGNGNIDVLTNTTATYTPTGTITGSSRLDVVYLTSSSGTATCLTAVDSIEIFVSATPSLELGADVSMCGNLSQVLTPQSVGVGNLLTWTSTNGSFATNPSPTGLYQPDFTVPTNNRPDGIIVTSIDSLGVCPAIKDTMLVTVYGLARVAIGATGVVCEDDSLSLNPAFAGRLSDFTYTVSNNAGIVAVNNNQLLYIPNENMTQSNRIDKVTINLGDVDGGGACPSLTDVIDITVLNTPRAELIKDTTICLGEELNLLVESFGLIDTFKSNLSNSLVNYPNLPINLVGGILKDTILYGTSLIDGACPAVSNQVIVTIQNPASFTINIPDTTICIANTLELTTGLSNTNGYNFRWKVAGNNGTFDDANKAKPIYTPNGVTTTSRVDVIMVEVVDATNICNVGFDTLLVTVVPSAILADFRDTTICEGETLNLSAAISGAATFFWSSNSGTFADSSATQTAYTHAPVNGGNGLDIITGQLVFENDACVGVQKNIKVTVIGESAVNAGLDTTICTGSTLQLAGTMGFGIDSVEWLVLDNAGTYDNSKSLTAIYTPAINTGTTDRVDVVILSTTATLTCIKPLDTLYVTVKPTPTVSLGTDLTQMGTTDLILSAVTSIPVIVGQWSADNGAFSNSTLYQTVYSANVLPEGVTRLDTIIYKGDFDITGCAILSDTLVITFEAPPTITRDAEFCEALCLDTALVNIDVMTNQAVVLANDIDPFDTCAVNADLTMKLWSPTLGIPEPLNVTNFSGLPDSVVYTCGDKGYQNLNVYVAVDSMDVRVCPSVIKVEDAFVTCGERTISGKITTFKGEPVAGFQVFIEIIGAVGGVVPAPVLTDAEGRYEFTLPSDRMYRITPKNNENLSKGVTAFDNVIISRHILGLEFFDSPFKTIAADVNKSGTVTAFDIVEIRKVVLDKEGGFSNNTSWRFVDASFPFENIMDAAAAPFQESFIVNETTGNTFDMDFIAIKVGDVNGSNFSSLNGERIADDRNNATAIAFEVANIAIKKGDTYAIPFRLLHAKKVAGYQFTLRFDGLELLAIQSGVATPAHFSTSSKDRGLLSTCWSTAHPMEAQKEWFTLQFRATKDGRLSELLAINSAITPMEAYTTADENIGVELTFVQPIATTFDLFQNKPNPFKKETVIGFVLPTATTAKITILDMQGKIINRVEGNYESGYNEVIMDMTALPRGVFYYRLETAFGTKVQKMMHIE